jgi:hypothetical protein
MGVDATRNNEVPESSTGSAEDKVKATKHCMDCGNSVLNKGYHLGTFCSEGCVADWCMTIPVRYQEYPELEQLVDKWRVILKNPDACVACGNTWWKPHPTQTNVEQCATEGCPNGRILRPGLPCQSK